MTIYTQIFLTNWIVLITLIALDATVFEDYIENTPVLDAIVNVWAAISLVCIPLWCVYAIWS